MRRPRLRFTVRRLMVAVAVVGVLLWAGLYRSQYGDIERSLTSIRLREFAEGDAVHRRMAVEFFASTEPDDLRRVLPVLAAAATDDDWQTRLTAVRSTGSATRRWRRVRNQATGEEIALAKQILIRAFNDPEDKVQLEAVRNLDLLADVVSLSAPPPISPAAAVTKDTQAVAPLLRLMSDDVAAVRAAAMSVFARIQPESGEGPDPVIGVMMNDPDAKVRAAAVNALAIGWPDLDLYSLLLRRLTEVNSPEERGAIGRTLVTLGPPPPESVPALLDALALDEWALNEAIPQVLAKLGPAGRPALPVLAKAAAREFTDPHGSPMGAARAVAAIDPDSAEAQALLAPLATMLRDSRENFRRGQAAMVLGLYGPSAAAVVPSLREALKSEFADVRLLTASLLGSIGPAARAALADLANLADRDPDRNVREVAAQAIRRIDVE